MDVPETSGKAAGAPSGTGVRPTSGGASPLPGYPSAAAADESECSYFIVIPSAGVRHYNVDVIHVMVGRLLSARTAYAPPEFPPVLEGWNSPASLCVKVRCGRRSFNEVRDEVLKIYTTFGGKPDMLKFYRSDAAEQV